MSNGVVEERAQLRVDGVPLAVRSWGDADGRPEASQADSRHAVSVGYRTGTGLGIASADLYDPAECDCRGRGRLEYRDAIRLQGHQISLVEAVADLCDPHRRDSPQNQLRIEKIRQRDGRPGCEGGLAVAGKIQLGTFLLLQQGRFSGVAVAAQDRRNFQEPIQQITPKMVTL